MASPSCLCIASPAYCCLAAQLSPALQEEAADITRARSGSLYRQEMLGKSKSVDPADYRCAVRANFQEDLRFSRFLNTQLRYNGLHVLISSYLFHHFEYLLGSFTGVSIRLQLYNRKARNLRAACTAAVLHEAPIATACHRE